MGFGVYAAGSVVAFGIVLMVLQAIGIFTTGMGLAELESLRPVLADIWLAANVGGGFAGGFLVARRRRGEYVLTGLVVGVLAYIFVFAYNLLIEGVTTDIFAFLCLVFGGVAGSMFFGSRLAGAATRVEPPKASNPQTAANAYSVRL